MQESKLLKALRAVSVAVSTGAVSVDVLIKANQAYCEKTGFDSDTEDYQILVAKSCFDYINGVDQDEEIAKAIVPGTTKVVDGIVYIYSATKPGSKNLYDWHIVDKSRGLLTDAQIDAKQKFVNDMFPKDLASLKDVKTLGGSTGAKLVEDVNGTQYVLKKGTNTSSEHVKSEYLGNQLYNVMGVRTPDYELYDEGGEAVLLSCFIPNASMPKPSDYKKMAQDFIADVVLANWDVYENDNCLIDASGRVIRVDNGSCLEFRAQGKKKTNPPYNSDVLKTYKDMRRYNPSVVGYLDDNDILKQIQKIQGKKTAIIDFLNQSGFQTLAHTVGARIDNLSQIVSEINRSNALKNAKVLPRTLKPASEMYRNFSQKEIDAFWKNAQGSGSYGKLNFRGTNGWDLLSTICKERGFDARPRVVDDATYWGIVAKAKNPQMFRGLTSGGGYSQDELVAQFKYVDDCYYGTMGVYGEGIYAHMNDGTKNQDNTKTGHVNSDAYRGALGYSGGGSGGVLYLAYEDDVKLASVSQLKSEILKNPPIAKNTSQAKKLQSQIDALDAELLSDTQALNNLEANTIQDVYQQMHYDEKAIANLDLDIDNIDWGALTVEGEPDIPDWKTFVEGNLASVIIANGGSVKKDPGMVTFTLPNSRTKFTLTEYQYNGPGAIKQKNSFFPPYHYNLKRFRQWIDTEHVQKIEAAKKAAVDDLGDTAAAMKSQITAKRNQRDKLVNDINKLKNPDPDSSIYAAIYHEVDRGNEEAIGVYAALKGYDGIYQPHGNGGRHSYAIILNRSKVIVKK